MSKGPTEKFKVQLKNGETVDVEWHQNYLAGVDHLELHGPMTSTGYRSEWLYRNSPDQALDRDEVIDHTRKLAQQLYEENEEKYGHQASMSELLGD